jgi:Domain of unknown function (DUF4440)
MKSILSLLLLCAATVPLSAQSDTSEDATTVIRALEQQWTTGQSRNDNDALNMIFDNALIYVEYGKLVSKGEYLARIKRTEPSSDQIEMQPTSVHIFGHTAIVVGVYNEKQLHDSRHESKRWRFIDTWIYKKNGWVLVAAGSSPISD